MSWAVPNRDGGPTSSWADPGRSHVELGGPRSCCEVHPNLIRTSVVFVAMLSAALRRIGKGYLAMIVNRFRAYNIQLPFLYLCLPPLIPRCFGFPYAPAPANSIPTIQFRRLSSIRCPRCPMSVRPRFHPSDVHRRPSSAVLVGSPPVVWGYVVRII